MTRLTPLQVCERMFDGIEATSIAADCAPKSAFGWRWESKNRDAGDIPSARHMRALLAHARTIGRPLTAQDLIYGADSADIDARLGLMNTPASPLAGVVCGATSLVAPKLPELGGGLAQAAPAPFSGKAEEPPAAAAVGGDADGSALPAGAGSGGPAPVTQDRYQGAA